MSRPRLFAELCAGSAAVTLRLLGGRHAKPPIAYMGGKRGYAHAILACMGLRSGQGADAVLLCDPGPWGRVWRVVADPAGCAEVARIIRGWVGEEPRALWERLRAEGWDGFDAGAVARFLWIGTSSGSRGADAAWFKPRVHTAPSGTIATAQTPDGCALRVTACGALLGGTRAEPDDARLLDPREVARWLAVHALSYAGKDGFKRTAGGTWPNRPPDVGATASTTAKAGAVMSCAPATGVLHGSALDLDPPDGLAGAVIYIDPPYQGTTGYAHDLPHADVLELSRRWRDAGALVVVSEAEPLALPGWHEVDITDTRVGQRRTFSRQRREFLTMSRPPAWRPQRQAALWAVGVGA